MENSTEDYRIQSFDQDTQVLLKTALKGQLFSFFLFFLTVLFSAFIVWMMSISNNPFVNTFLFLSDPGAVNLEKVSNIIVDQSLKDQVFSKEAGRICYTIVQVHTRSSLRGCSLC